jgi:hypothetical protein
MGHHADLFRAAVYVLLLSAGPGMAFAEDTAASASWKDGLPFKLEGEIEVGGQTISGNTGSPTLFEYRDLFGKPTIPTMRLKAEDRLGTKFLEFGGTNMTRTDANFFLTGGAYNQLRFDFDYDRQPHIIGLNRSTIYTDVGGGTFVLPSDPAQCNRVSAFNSTNAGDIASSVNCLLQPTSLGHQTDTARMGLRYLLTPNLELRADYSRINKEGTRPIGGVIGNPGSNLTERAMLRDERIHEVKAGAEYAGDWYQARFAYTGSLFDNGLTQMQWDNVCGADTAGCRNPSGLGRLSLMPDNIAHTFAGAGGASLPWWQTPGDRLGFLQLLAAESALPAYFDAFRGDQLVEFRHAARREDGRAAHERQPHKPPAARRHGQPPVPVLSRGQQHACAHVQRYGRPRRLGKPHDENQPADQLPQAERGRRRGMAAHVQADRQGRLRVGALGSFLPRNRRDERAHRQGVA